MFKESISKISERLQISRKFSLDVMANIGAFGVMGIIGIVLNLIIAKYYDAATLGVFNQVYAIYIFLSQIAVGGIHLSLLKYISQYGESKADQNAIMTSALIIAALFAAVISMLAYWGRFFIGAALDSEAVASGILYAVPGLYFFTLNKLYLAYHNAMRRMRLFAVAQSLRYILMVLSLVLLVHRGASGAKLCMIFSIAEIALFLMLFFVSFKWLRFQISGQCVRWVRDHVCFGFKAAFGHILADVNTRVDVLMLGVFLSDSMVGIYSFAAMIADGLNHLPVVFRTNVNPLITRALYGKGKEELRQFVCKGRNLFYFFMIPVSFVVILCYPYLIKFFGFSTVYEQGWGILAVLVGGTMLAAGYLPFQMILNQAGYPFYNTLLVCMYFMTNVILNYLLIPEMAIWGAAIATATAMVLQVLYLKILVRRKIEIAI